MTEEQLWNWMMEGNYPPGYPDFDRKELVALNRRAFATLSRDITMTKWQGHYKSKLTVKVAAGTRVKVVMASRLCDVGITDDLTAHNGYHYRVHCVESEWEVGGNTVPMHPEGLLLDIEPVEDPRADKVALAFPAKED